ncbi:hypothetical protein PIROE2DRAFT_7974 [Piromyces sp. E2]|nr:hypothetical protein PIROE2DRAFT_7974 [Piromyces sp. E2]|eukprot:OUM65086.1 hypothetical protein PIROE2DRAFT_7974 [Piromyces sp. E2]
MEFNKSIFLNLYFSCKNLNNKDMFSKRDPMIELYMDDTLVGRTEIIKNNLNPSFNTPVKIQYYFEKRQNLTIKVIDIDDEKELTGDNLGQAKGIKLAKMDLFGKSDPYYSIYRIVGPKKVKVYQSEVIKKTLNPEWKAVIISKENLNVNCLAEGQRYSVEVYDHDKFGSDDYIGEVEFENLFYNITPDGQEFRGILSVQKTVSSYQVISNYNFATELITYPYLLSPISFIDAMRMGMNLHIMCAVDYTSSNGKMHDVKTNEMNPYQTALSAVGQVLEPYDHDKKFSFFGTRDQLVLADMGSAKGGDMDWRANKRRYYSDDFYQIINAVADKAEADMMRKFPPNSHRLPSDYYILFFVIDGDEFDRDGTVRALVRASALPMSIVLIGVGGSNFTNISKYDADDRPLSVDGVSTIRDIIQFVKFNEFKDNCEINMTKLASKVLAKVPTQIETFIGLYDCNNVGTIHSEN